MTQGRQTPEELAALFNDTVVERAEEVDPGEDFVWDGVCMGWLIGKGYSPEEAWDMLRIVYP